MRETSSAAQIAAERGKRRYSTFLPFFIVLMTLVFSTVRDMATLYKHTALIHHENAMATEPLRKAGEQGMFVDSLRIDLQKLASSDPAAARVVSDFFPPPPPPPSPPPSLLPPSTKTTDPNFTPFTAPKKSGNPEPNGGAKTTSPNFTPFTAPQKSGAPESNGGAKTSPSFTPFTAPAKTTPTPTPRKS